jgi:N-acetylneuraminic acid mutarotase/fibronectin type 3 domain-containing protein
MKTLRRLLATILLALGLIACTQADRPAGVPSAPTNLRATVGEGQVELSWNASAGATGYNVYRSDSPNVERNAENRQNATLVRTTSFTDTDVENGRTYHYAVTAVGPGGESSASSSIEASLEEDVLAAPGNLRAEARDGEVVLSWEESSGAIGYNAYRSETPDVEVSAANRQNATLIRSTSFTDTNVENDRVYHYVVTAVAANGRESVRSNEESVEPTAPPNQAPVVDAGEDKSITWPNNTVLLEGSASDDGLPDPPGELTTVWSQVSGPGTVTFADASSPVTAASFSSVGVYVLRLTADDGELKSSDETTIAVNDVPADFTTVSWSTAAPNPRRRSEAQGKVVDGKLYVFGGYNSFTPVNVLTNIDVYDPATDTWTSLDEPMPTPLTHIGAALEGQDIYFAGGYVGLQGGGQIFATDEVWKFNVDSLEWTPLPPLPEARGSGGLAIIEGNLHFFAGSDIRRHDRSEHWILSLDDLEAGWRSAPALVPGRNHHAAVTLGGKIYSIGGQQGQDAAHTALELVTVWDPATSTWTEAAPLPIPLSHISASVFVMGERIIVAGGEIAHDRPVANVWAYSPSEDTWTELTSLPAPRRSGVAGTIDGEIIFTAGGNPGFAADTYRGVPLE